MMVYFRRRFPVEDMVWIQELIAKSTKEKTKGDTDKGPPSNSGKLIVDATVVPADIKYPTDVNLLDEAREKSERIIDALYVPLRGKEQKPKVSGCLTRKSYPGAGAPAPVWSGRPGHARREPPFRRGIRSRLPPKMQLRPTINVLFSPLRLLERCGACPPYSIPSGGESAPGQDGHSALLPLREPSAHRHASAWPPRDPPGASA